MKTLRLLCLVGALLVGLLSLVGWQSPPRLAWDYRVEKMDLDGWDKNNRFETHLDSLGAAGWELVIGMERRVSGSFSAEPAHILVFKRPR